MGKIGRKIRIVLAEHPAARSIILLSMLVVTLGCIYLPAFFAPAPANDAPSPSIWVVFCLTTIYFLVNIAGNLASSRIESNFNPRDRSVADFWRNDDLLRAFAKAMEMVVRRETQDRHSPLGDDARAWLDAHVDGLYGTIKSVMIAWPPSDPKSVFYVLKRDQFWRLLLPHTHRLAGLSPRAYTIVVDEWCTSGASPLAAAHRAYLARILHRYVGKALHEAIKDDFVNNGYQFAALAQTAFTNIQTKLADLGIQLNRMESKIEAIHVAVVNPKSGSVPPKSYLPRNPNATFVGRVNELNALHASLTSASAATAITQGFSGAGGIGKSQLAQRYTEQFAGHWDGRWWLDCSRDAHRTELSALAKVLGVTLAAEQAFENDPTGLYAARAWHHAARQAIAQRLCDGKRHLLVLDNVEHAHADSAGNPDRRAPVEAPWAVVTDFALPAGCAVLITTRDQTLPLPLATVVKLDVLSPVDARALLRKRFENCPNKTPDPHWPDADLDGLADLLGCHALAVDLAAAWLYRSRGALSPSVLSAQLKSSDAELLNLFEHRHLQGTAHHYTLGVAATLALHMDDPAIVPALPLLHAAAFFAPDNMPLGLLAAAAGMTEPAARDAAGDLESRSILSWSVASAGRALDVHRLTQSVVRQRLTKAGTFETALNQVLNAHFNLYWYPDTPEAQALDHTRTPARLVGFPHVQVALRHREGVAEAGLKSVAARLQAGLSQWLPDIGNHAAALQAIDASIGWSEAQTPRDGRDLAIMYSSRATIRHNRGDLAGAEADLQKSIDWGEAQDPRDERSLAIWYASRATIRQARGDLAGAEADLQKSIDWGEAQSPRDERNLAIWYASRASIRQLRGDLAGAEEDLQKSIDWGETQSPRDERSLAIDYVSRASLRQVQGDLAGAEADLQKSIDWGEAQSPRDERNLAIMYATRARIYRDRKRYAEARRDIEAALAWVEANLPGDERSIGIMRQVRDSIPPG